jgi:hypothetical protein
MADSSAMVKTVVTEPLSSNGGPLLLRYSGFYAARHNICILYSDLRIGEYKPRVIRSMKWAK